jgi:hypothetical protein
MSTIDILDSGKKSRIRISKSLGNRLVEDKIRFNKLQEIKIKTFNKAINDLNKTLKRSESLLQINHYPKKNDIDSFFPKNEVIFLKKLDYYKKWHFNNNILPKIEKKNFNNNRNKINKNNINNNENKNSFPLRYNFKYLGSLYRANKNSDIRKNKNKKDEEENIPFYFKGLEPRKNNINASEIVKQSILELNKKNVFKRYRYNMEEKVGNFVDYNDKYSNYYDYDKKVKKNIKDEMTGISIPGNVLNRSNIGFIRTLQPKNVRTKIKKSISVPEKTLLPVPTGIVGKGLNYTHITLKNVYNEKNKLI